MITDRTQSIDTDAATMFRSDWARVRQDIFLVSRNAELIRHFAILSDGCLVLVRARVNTQPRGCGTLHDHVAT